MRIQQVKTGVDRSTITNEAVLLISSKADALRAQTGEYYEGQERNPLHDEAYMEVLKRGLKLKKSSDIFTDEEREFFDKIDSAEEEARELFSELSREKESIERAMKADSLYTNSFRPEGESLPELLVQNENEQGAVMDIIAQLMETRSIATGIGWDRYEAMLHKNYRRINNEVRAIVKELKAVTFLEKDTIKLDFPKALHIQYETEYYEANTLLVLPEDVTLETTEEVLTPLLYHHRKALEASEYSTTFINTLIHSKNKELAKSAEITIGGDALASLYTTAVENYTFTKDKVSNQLTKLTEGVTRPLAFESKDEKKKGVEITTLVTLNFDELSKGEDGIKKLKYLDNMDKAVLRAVVSVWESAYQNEEIVNGEAITTLQKLYRIITKNPNSRLDAKTEQDLVNRLMKLTSAIITIDATAESKHYKALANFEKTGALISVVVDRAIINGNSVDNAVHITNLNQSPLYFYAKLKGQLASVPMKYLDTRARNMNEETIFISNCLEDCIERIKKNKQGKLIYNEIIIDKLLDDAGIYEKDYKNFKKKRSDVVKKIDELLAGYVGTGYIKKYEFVPGKRMKYYKIVITPNPNRVRTQLL
jgi:hypothetical protein